LKLGDEAMKFSKFVYQWVYLSYSRLDQILKKIKEQFLVSQTISDYYVNDFPN